MSPSPIWMHRTDSGIKTANMRVDPYATPGCRLLPVCVSSASVNGTEATSPATIERHFSRMEGMISSFATASISATVRLDPSRRAAAPTHSHAASTANREPEALRKWRQFPWPSATATTTPSPSPSPIAEGDIG